MLNNIFYTCVLAIFLLTSCGKDYAENAGVEADDNDSILVGLQTQVPGTPAYREQLLHYVKSNPTKYAEQPIFVKALSDLGEYLGSREENDSQILALSIEAIHHSQHIPPCLLPGLAQGAAMLLHASGQNDSAELLYNKALFYNAACRNDTFEAKVKMRLGNLFYRSVEYKKALEAYRTSLDISVRLHDSDLVESIRGNMANVYMDLKSYDKSIPLYVQCKKDAWTRANYQSVLTANCCLVNCYLALHDTARSLQMALEAVALLDSLRDNHYACFYANYSYAHVLLTTKQYAQTLSTIEKSIDAAEKMHNDYCGNQSKLLMASALIQLKDFTGAKKVLNALLSHPETISGDPVFENDISAMLAEAEEGSGHYKEALAQFKKHYKTKDSLNSLENSVQIMRLEKQYEQQGRESRLHLQEQELQVLKKDKRYLLILLSLGVVIAVLVILVVSIRRKRSQLNKENKLKEHFSRELIATTEKERSRIARELHDGIASDLLLIHVAAESGSEQASRIEQVLDNIRDITHSLFPMHLSKVKLAGALNSLVNALDRETGIFFTLEEEVIPNKLSPEQELYAFRIAQEALNNIIKHAEAKAVVVKLYYVNKAIHLYISDNGIGFQDKNPANSAGIGLILMKQRAAHIQADLTIQSASGEGCKVHLVIPVL